MWHQHEWKLTNNPIATGISSLMSRSLDTTTFPNKCMMLEPIIKEVFVVNKDNIIHSSVCNVDTVFNSRS